MESCILFVMQKYTQFLGINLRICTISIKRMWFGLQNNDGRIVEIWFHTDHIFFKKDFWNCSSRLHICLIILLNCISFLKHFLLLFILNIFYRKNLSINRFFFTFYPSLDIGEYPEYAWPYILLNDAWYILLHVGIKILVVTL